MAILKLKQFYKSLDFRWLKSAPDTDGIKPDALMAGIPYWRLHLLFGEILSENGFYSLCLK
jgi:hypothetical protein